MSLTDHATFAALVREHEAGLRRYAASLVRGSGADPDDVLQDVWLRLHRWPPPEGPSTGWLYTLTRNCAFDARRAAGGGAGDAGLADVAAPGSVADTVARRDEVRNVLGDLSGLGGRQRHAFVRHVLHGAPHEAVAEELDVTPQGSKSLVLRARRTLRRRAERRQDRLWGVLPWGGVKALAVLTAGAIAAGSAWTVTRHDVVEPWHGPDSPAWTLGPGNAFSTHHVTVDEAARDRPLELGLRCPDGYVLFQVDAGAGPPPVRFTRRDPGEWLGARATTWRIEPLPGRPLPAAFDVEVTCRRPDLLRREMGLPGA